MRYVTGSAFRRVHSNQSDASTGTNPKPPLTAAMKRKNIYIIIFVAGLALSSGFALWPNIVYGANIIVYGEQYNYGCPVDIGKLTFQISNYIQLVGPPLFTREQFVIAPGSTTYLTYLWNATSNGNNVTDWFTRTPHYGFNYTYLQKINTITGDLDGIPTNVEGVSETFQNITFQGIHVAKILYKISLNHSTAPATYEMTPSCSYHLLMTVGSLPYWGPLPYGEIQPMVFLFNVGISLVASSILIMTLHVRYSASKKENHENSLHGNQLKPQ